MKYAPPSEATYAHYALKRTKWQPKWIFLLRVAGLGFEPRYSHPKGDVLPLDDPAVCGHYK